MSTKYSQFYSKLEFLGHKTGQPCIRANHEGRNLTTGTKHKQRPGKSAVNISIPFHSRVEAASARARAGQARARRALDTRSMVYKKHPYKKQLVIFVQFYYKKIRNA